MAHFYGSLKPDDKPEVTRNSTKKGGLRASCDGYDIGATCRIRHTERVGDLVHFELDNGTNLGNDGCVIARAYRNETGAMVIEPDDRMLLKVSDEYWDKILQDTPALAKKLATLLFKNLDAVQRDG